MNVFEEVKQNVTVRQAAELYGFKPNRSGLIRCIFHNDGTPSMKVDRRYYCFGCGCTGDVIDFTAQLFGLKSREAALKLADDFGISYGNRARDSPKSGKKSLVKERGKVSETDWKTECARLTKAYLDYRTLLLEWKECYAPKTPEEEWKAEFIEACQQIEKINYDLDLLVFGELQDRIEFLLDSGKDVKRIEERMEEYRRNNKEQTGRSIGSEGNEL